MADGRVKIRIEGDSSGFESTLAGVEAGIGKMSSLLAGVGAAAGAFMADKVAQGVGTLISTVDKASDFNETLSKTGVIFGDELVPALEEWASTGAEAFGQSKQQALDAAATFAIFGKSAGLSGDALAEFSKTQVQLASDLSSFHNASPEDTIFAIGAALRGESEPMRKYGVLLDAASVKAKAMSMGLVEASVDTNVLSKKQETAEKALRKYNDAIKEHGENSVQAADANRDLEQAQADVASTLEGKVGDLTAEQKVLATNALILEQTADAQGDYARTSDGLANSQRSMTAQWENMQIAIGEKLLPVKIKLVKFIVDKVMPALNKLGKAVGPIITEIVGGFKAFVAAFKAGDGDVTSSGFPGFMEKVAAISRQVFDWLRENVPPVMEMVKRGLQVAAEFIQEKVLPLWPKLVAGFQFVVDAVNTKIAPMVPQVIAFFTAIADFVSIAIERIVQIVGWGIDLVMFIWNAWGEQLVNILVAVWDVIWGVLGGVITMLTGIFNLIKDLLSGNWSALWDDIKQILSGAWQVIWTILGGAFDILKNLLSMAWEGVKGAVGLAWDGIKALFQLAMDAQIAIVGGALDKIIEFFKGLGTRLLDAMGDLVGFLTRPFREAFNLIAGYWNDTVGSLQVSVPSWVPEIGGKGFNMPTIPRLAEGGLAFNPMLAIVGDHKTGGAEIIAPEAKMAEVVRANSGPSISIGVINMGNAGVGELSRELSFMMRTKRAA